MSLRIDVIIVNIMEVYTGQSEELVACLAGSMKHLGKDKNVRSVFSKKPNIHVDSTLFFQR